MTFKFGDSLKCLEQFLADVVRVQMPSLANKPKVKGLKGWTAQTSIGQYPPGVAGFGRYCLLIKPDDPGGFIGIAVHMDKRYCHAEPGKPGHSQCFDQLKPVSAMKTMQVDRPSVQV